jgi:hypothetical protein
MIVRDRFVYIIAQYHQLCNDNHYHHHDVRGYRGHRHLCHPLYHQSQHFHQLLGVAKVSPLHYNFTYYGTLGALIFKF